MDGPLRPLLPRRGELLWGSHYERALRLCPAAGVRWRNEAAWTAQQGRVVLQLPCRRAPVAASYGLHHTSGGAESAVLKRLGKM